MNCLRTDLVFSDYLWPEPHEADNHFSEGSGLFNRRNGYQMLCLLNSLSASWRSPKTNDFFGNVEKVIRQLVPARLVTVQEVQEWIESRTPRL